MNYIEKNKVNQIVEKFLEMDFINKNLEKSLFQTSERTIRKKKTVNEK